MSAFGGKADMTLCGIPLSRSLLGAKRTSPCALHMSAYDPKRTSALLGFSRPRQCCGHRDNIFVAFAQSLHLGSHDCQDFLACFCWLCPKDCCCTHRTFIKGFKYLVRRVVMPMLGHQTCIWFNETCLFKDSSRFFRIRKPKIRWRGRQRRVWFAVLLDCT